MIARIGTKLLPLTVLGFVLLVAAGSLPPTSDAASGLAAAGMALLLATAWGMSAHMRSRSQPPDWDRELTLAKMRVHKRAGFGQRRLS